MLIPKYRRTVFIKLYTEAKMKIIFKIGYDFIYDVVGLEILGDHIYMTLNRERNERHCI
ncbi:hypothetical protein [Paraglaciecola sp.]|uniref:hypothetical protein n=1 Tax=Paraglaciecola sp. TaxID=1920173 RepID=UPI0035566546